MINCHILRTKQGILYWHCKEKIVVDGRSGSESINEYGKPKLSWVIIGALNIIRGVLNIIRGILNIIQCVLNIIRGGIFNIRSVLNIIRGVLNIIRGVLNIIRGVLNIKRGHNSNYSLSLV